MGPAVGKEEALPIMQDTLGQEFVCEVYRRVLGRDPSADEVAEADRLIHLRGVRAFVLLVCAKPADTVRRPEEFGPLFVPPGHYYSPIVDPDELVRSGFVEPQAGASMPGISLGPDRMLATFNTLARHFPAIDFPETLQASHRYYYQNEFYGYGDAIILSAILREFRPRRIIEVGSGFSSAAMLDTLDSAGLDATTCTFIEPYPDRLRGLLRPADHRRVEILERPVQHVPLEIFSRLGSGDLLFMDTTHISKTGSDVNHELFEVLPALQPGVLLHFHDVFWPFEYPHAWIIDQNRSWNELYLLRAFLMHNRQYEIVYFNHFFDFAFHEHVQRINPLISRNCGGGLWLRKL